MILEVPGRPSSWTAFGNTLVGLVPSVRTYTHRHRHLFFVLLYLCFVTHNNSTLHLFNNKNKDELDCVPKTQSQINADEGLIDGLFGAGAAFGALFAPTMYVHESLFVAVFVRCVSGSSRPCPFVTVTNKLIVRRSFSFFSPYTIYILLL